MMPRSSTAVKRRGGRRRARHGALRRGRGLMHRDGLTMKRLLPSILAAALALAASSAPAAAAPEQVKVGIYLNQVSAIDLKANTFQADFWIWFRYTGEELSPLDTFEIVGGRIASRGNVLSKELEGGVRYRAVRVGAVIQQQFDLRRFPFDDHQLRIQIEDTERESAKAVYVADTENEGVDPDMVLSGFRVVRSAHEAREHTYHSNYGDTSVATGATSTYSRYVFRADLERLGWGRFFKLFFGLFVATLVSWCGYFILPRDASPRVAVSVGALFAASAVTVAINGQLPDVSYVTLADRIVYLSLGMILTSLIGTVIVLSLHYAGREAQHRALDRRSAIVFPIVYAAAMVAILSFA